MKYMLMMHTPPDVTGGIGSWSPQDVQAHIEFQHRFDRGLAETGELVCSEGLTFPDRALVVRADETGAAVVTDGPFPESKEFLMGFWIVDVPTPKRAYEIAALASSAPGPGGQPLNIPIEVRPVAGPPSIED